MKKIVLASFFFCIILLSCGKHIPQQSNIVPKHSSAVEVQNPSIKYEGPNRRLIFTLLSTSILASGGWYIGASEKISKDNVPFTRDELKKNASIQSLAFGGLGLLFSAGYGNQLMIKRKTKNTYVNSEKDFITWLGYYNNKTNKNYTLVSNNGNKYTIVEVKNKKLFDLEELRILEIENQKKLATERKIKEDQENLDYLKIKDGISLNLNDYFAKYDVTFRNYKEVSYLKDYYTLYRNAKKGGLNDASIYLQNSNHTFMREDIKRKADCLTNTVNNKDKINIALSKIFGQNRKVAKKDGVHELQLLSQKNDYLATLWLTFLIDIKEVPRLNFESNFKNVILKEELIYLLENKEMDAYFIFAYNNLAKEISNNSKSSVSETTKILKSIINSENNAIYYYLFGSLTFNQGLFDLSHEFFEKSQKLGLTRANTGIGLTFAKKDYDLYNLNLGLENLKIAYEQGDQDAALHIALIKNRSIESAKDVKEIIRWANIAAANQNPNANALLSQIYTADRFDLKKNPVFVEQYLKEAIKLGHSESMFVLAIMYIDGITLGFKNVKKGLDLLQNASNEGNGNASLMLAKLYDEGKSLSKNEISARYWFNKAQIQGIGEGNKKPEFESPLETIFRLGDFSPTYTVYYDRYSGEELSRTQDFGSGIVGGLMGGMFSGWLESYQYQQRVINGCEMVEELGDKKIYSATLTSRTKTSIFFGPGSTVNFKSFGTVKLGFFAGTAGPNGTYGNQNYSIDSSLPHGCVMWRVNNEKWHLVGSYSDYSYISIIESGNIELAINDNDYTNNQGYFDVIIEVK